MGSGSFNQIKRKKERKVENKKAKRRLNLINKTQISMKNWELNFVPLRRGVLVPHGKYSFLFNCT